MGAGGRSEHRTDRKWGRGRRANEMAVPFPSLPHHKMENVTLSALKTTSYA